MKKPKGLLQWSAVLVSTTLLLLVGGIFIGLPSYILGETSQRVAEALRDPQSVTITELETYRDLPSGDATLREVVIRTITASPEQISQFRRATGGFLDFGFPRAHSRCFEPHHRIEIVRADGTTLRLEVCFFCSNIRFDSQVPQAIPRP